MPSKRKRIQERTWLVAVRPTSQPTANFGLAWVYDGGASNDPKALAAVLGEAVKDAVACAHDTFGDMFEMAARDGRIFIDARVVEPEDGDAQ